MLDRRQFLEHIYVLRILTVLAQLLDSMYRLHVGRLRVVERHSALAVASIAPDTSRHKRIKGTSELII